MHATLMVMAAGLGARYGGNKQIDRMGPNGEILMEYSIFDAMEAGFDRVVFVIRKGMEAVFREKVGDRLAQKVQIVYAYQENDTLPSGFVPPHDRIKPYGTVHAVICAKDLIHEPFAVINADDYYGKSAFQAMYGSLCTLPEKGHASMVGYRLSNTVSENGHVTRGVCRVDASGRLRGITETYKIIRLPDGSIKDTEKDAALDPNSLVSMNFWGFTPWIFTSGERYMQEFLNELPENEMKREYPLPVMVDSMMGSGQIQVNVLSTEDSWFGVTYQEDKAYVGQALADLHKAGFYPAKLF
jgi:NDP-sugar pyrophosphorylase family protein